jgi:hypothetical protein
MMGERDQIALRRYVLGRSSAEERDRVEHGYFADPDALDFVCAAEDDLIDEYLSNSLVGEEREHFETYYLATPQHRTRVAVARALRRAASLSHDRIESQTKPEATTWATFVAVRSWPRVAHIAAAAGLVLLAGGVGLLLWPTSKPETTTVTTSAPSPPAVTSPSAPSVRAPREPEAPGRDKAPAVPPAVAPIVAFSISPINVRGASESARLSIPRGTGTIRLLLQGDASEPPLARGRVIVRTVPGREVWRGITLPPSTSESSLARVDVPAGRLPPDDYIVELLAPNESGRPLREVERYRYFFSVRRGQDENRR